MNQFARNTFGHALTAILIGSCVLFTQPTHAQNPPSQAVSTLPSETPEQFQETSAGFEYTRRNVLIPMRDSVKLHTIILVPKGTHRAPILLTRTPYDATALTTRASSAHLGPTLTGYDNATDVIIEGGYIRVVQDIRGKYKSEGDYVMNRPLRGPQNPTAVDHATDTYDTIDWLVKNVPESNGRVGILGISYNGFLTLMALVDPHPALKVAVPMNPMVDGWMGDDWFHNGAFRQQMMPYFYEQEATRGNDVKWWSTHFDDYDMYLQAVSAGELGRQRRMEQLGFWRKLIEHPSYDAFWQEQAVDKILAARPLTVPLMLVHSLWDQEDIYGAPAVYSAIEPKDVFNDRVFLVIGPWCHGQEIGDGSTLGALRFESNTARDFRRDVLRPFLDSYLKEGAPHAKVAPVTAFQTGTNQWVRLSAWPARSADGYRITTTPLYLRPGAEAGFEAPAAGASPYTEYISDPAKPVPYRTRPVRPFGYDDDRTWWRWLVDDQRNAAARPDVVSFVSAPLTAPLLISGQPMANLVASTDGTDSDWVVKLIDVFPEEFVVPGKLSPDAQMGGYQLMVAADIFRGRYRESFEAPKALTPNAPLTYRFELPTVNHVFQPGHRIMVQVQSSWFPLYDRNPQTFVASIFFAKHEDYRKAMQRVYHTPGKASFVELPLVK